MTIEKARYWAENMTELSKNDRLWLNNPVIMQGVGLAPMVVAAFPLVARMVETSLREVNHGVIEAAQSMGASSWQIVRKVLLPEAVPSLLSGAAITIGTILGYGAMTGIVGGGGLGKLAINYGYYNFKFIVMWAAVIGLIILVQIFQSAGTKLAAACDKRLRNRS